MTRGNRDIVFLIVFAIVAMITNALQAPEWVAYTLIFIGGIYIVLSSPKIEEDKPESVLDKALKETSVQLKGIEALDEHFKKHPYKHNKGKLKGRR